MFECSWRCSKVSYSLCVCVFVCMFGFVCKAHYVRPHMMCVCVVVIHIEAHSHCWENISMQFDSTIWSLKWWFLFASENVSINILFAFGDFSDILLRFSCVFVANKWFTFNISISMLNIETNCVNGLEFCFINSTLYSVNALKHFCLNFIPTRPTCNRSFRKNLKTILK